MKRRNPWPAALLCALGFLAFALLAGWWVGAPLLGLSLALAGLFAWNLWQLWRLESWLRRDHRREPPRARGIWGEILDALYRQQERNRRRRSNLYGMLRRYRESARAMPDATVVLRGDYRIEWANDAARTLLGLEWPRDEGQRISNIYRHPDFVEFVDRHTPDARSITLPSPHSERRLLEIRLVPYGDAQYLLLARDITHVYRLERMRRDFVANVSHELRTPLTVIYGVAETLEEQIVDDDAARRSLALLQEQTTRMRRLVDDLLLLARLESGDMPEEQEPVDVAVMLATLIDEARAVADERGHRIALESADALLLRGSAGELRSAFSNLLFNAIKYTPANGDIRVRWRDVGDEVCFEVEDNGIGIPAHHLDRITERFYRVDDARAADSGGTGLGLAIVKHVLVRHGGRLDVWSEPGKGSRFACCFPKRLAEPAEIAGTP